MRQGYKQFLSESEINRRGVFDLAAQKYQVPPEYIEKDFWVCVTLDILFNSNDLSSHKMLFKGGTALSKGYDLIKRFSEDIDIVVFRDDLGFDGDNDPTNRKLNIGKNKRNDLFSELRHSCQTFMDGDLTRALNNVTSEYGCMILKDENDIDCQTTLLQYKSLYDKADYVKPVVKIEGGAKSGTSPHNNLTIKPYISSIISVFNFEVPGVRTIDPKRTFWEKVLILHGLHCGFRDDKSRIPGEANRLSRHYYDVAMLSMSNIGANAIDDISLLNEVRDHNIIAFNQKWKRFEEAIPGNIMIYPQNELADVIERDYLAMSGMIMGEAPPFQSILKEIKRLHNLINPS